MPDGRPLLLLDVDGPLRPFSGRALFRPRGYRSHQVPRASWMRGDPSEPEQMWLNPSHGPALLALPYDLVWCTAWRSEANTGIGPFIGLPELPAIEWESMFHGDPDGLHWKTRQLSAWAGGRPLVWVDDEAEPHDAAWLAAHHPAPARVLIVDHRHGLRPADFATLTTWAAELAGGAAPGPGGTVTPG
ncbi:hypothetical protein ACGFX4_21975 [Kitasatospora sp. NPDC048365]|uniref:hypothetical protein n=1 Tax=Kitasatospora sp. NPDC048365 TaxID=3364050 RepID=UPI00370FA48F